MPTLRALLHPALDSIAGRVGQAHRVLTMLQFFAPQTFTEIVKSFFREDGPNLQKLAEGQRKEVLPLFGEGVFLVPIVIAKAAIQEHRNGPTHPLQPGHPFANSASGQLVHAALTQALLPLGTAVSSAWKRRFSLKATFSC